MLTKLETVDKAVALVTLTSGPVTQEMQHEGARLLEDLEVQDIAILLGAVTGLCRAALTRLHEATGEDENALLQEIALKARREA